MNDLNTVPNTGTFGEAIGKVNTNFLAIKTAIDQLELNTTRSKGFFSSASALSTMYPSPVVGDWAVVQVTEDNVTSNIIYKCSTAGTWSSTGTAWAGGSIDLTQYVPKSSVETSPAQESANPISSGAVWTAKRDIEGEIAEEYRYGEGLSGVVSNQLYEMPYDATTHTCTVGPKKSSTTANKKYRVNYYPQKFSKGDIIHFHSEATSQKTGNYGFTTQDPSQVTLAGLVVDHAFHCSDTLHDYYLEVPYDDAYLVYYYHTDNWVSGTRVFTYFKRNGLKDKVEHLNEHLNNNITEHLTLEEFNHISSISTATANKAGKIYMLSSANNGVYDSYVQSDGVKYLFNCPFKFIGKATKTITYGSYGSNYVRSFGKGNYILSSGVVYQGSNSGTDVRVRVYDVSEHNGEFLRLQFHRYSPTSGGNNVGWSFYKKVYEEAEDAETGETTQQLVSYANYDFTDPANVLLCGTQPDPKTLAYAWVVCPQDAYLLAVTYYNNNDNANGQKCGVVKLEPVDYASLSIVTPIIEQVALMSDEVSNTAEALNGFLNGYDYVSDKLVAVGRTAKKFIVATTGALSSGSYGASGRYYVSNYIDVTAVPSLSYKLKIYCKQNVAAIAAYDQDHNYIPDNSVILQLKSSSATALGIWVKRETTRYIRITLDTNYSGYYVKLTNSFPSLESRVASLENVEDTTPVVVERNQEAGAVLTQMRYRGNTTGQNTTTTTVFIHFSDIHGKTSNMKSIVAFRDYYATLIDDVVNTGDTVANSFPNDSPQKQSGAEDFLTAIGNHDTATYSSGSYNWTAHVGVDAYNKYLKPYMFTEEDEEIVNRWGVVQPEDAETNGYCFYYKDYPSGVRLIILDSMDSREAQETWLTNVLANAKTNGKTVVCATHCVSGEITVLPCGMSNSQTTTGKSYGGASQLNHVMAIQSFIDAGGEFACWLEGHAHTDAVGYLTNNPRQLVVRVAMAAYDNTQTAVSRRSSGVSFDDFNIVCVDPSNKWVQLCKVGSPFGRNLMRREPTTINYNAMKVVWPKVYSLMAEIINEGDTDDN